MLQPFEYFRRILTTWKIMFLWACLWIGLAFGVGGGSDDRVFVAVEAFEIRVSLQMGSPYCAGICQTETPAL